MHKILCYLLTQKEGNKLSDKEIKKQLGKIKDNEIQTRLDLLRRGGNTKDDNNNNKNNNKDNNNNFPSNNPPDIPPGFPPNFPFDPLSPPDSPSFFSAPPFPTAPPFTSFFLPPLFAPLTPSATPLSDHNTTFAEKIPLSDSGPKIRTLQKSRIILMPKVEEIPKTEEKITISETLFREANQLF